MKILVLNAGSSSQKSYLYEITGETLPNLPPQPLWEAKVDWTHHQNMAEIEVKNSYWVNSFKKKIPVDSRLQVIARMLDTLCQGSTQVIAHPSEIDVVGHRVVHGGENYQESVVVNESVKKGDRRSGNSCTCT